MWSETLPTFPGYDVFGGTVKRKIISGNRKSVLEYNMNEHKWSFLQNAIKERKDGSAMCPINNTTLILAGGEKNGNTAELLSFYDYNSSKSPELHSESHFDQTITSSLSKWSLCEERLPVEVSHHSLTKINNRKILLVGGIINDLPSDRVFEGIFFEGTKNIAWNELKTLKRARQSHITFKLGHNIYVAGGQGLNTQEVLSCCEVYNLHNKKWVKSSHKLPYSLYDASVVVDPEETFALITGNFALTSGASNNVIIFTEQHGFRIFDTFSLKISRFGHMSTTID
jgi:N-acetylneuraminic acid mutarotase